VRTVTYCENDAYARGVLLSRMAGGELDNAPIWDDVRTLRGEMLPGIDIIFGGFPCQDISVAGSGSGLAGERSGLFFEIVRIAEEVRPAFLFLENVPAIRSRGLARVCFELAHLGFNLRWTTVSAEEVGAPHLRRRWFLLAAHADRLALRNRPEWYPGRWPRTVRAEGKAQPLVDGKLRPLAADPDSDRIGLQGEWLEEHGELEGASRDLAERLGPGGRRDGQALADSTSERREDRRFRLSPDAEEDAGSVRGGEHAFGNDWWAVEPDVGRVAHGVPARVDRLRCLGNAVVPRQAREAFLRLSGISEGGNA
jgi:DNA (cytosine-5)-methyltransferase 1